MVLGMKRGQLVMRGMPTGVIVMAKVQVEGI